MFFKHSNEGMQKIVDVNILGVMYGTKVAYKTFEKLSKGHIFNMEGFGSDGRKMDKLTLYGGTKIAVRYLTQSMAKEIKGSPIGISALSPGMVMTDFLLDSVKGNDEEAARRKKFYNILADTVEDVTEYLGRKILVHHKNNGRIMWLTTPKVMARFISAPFNRRDFFKNNSSD
jgi:short-subunit dehydrogenase